MGVHGRITGSGRASGRKTRSLYQSTGAYLTEAKNVFNYTHSAAPWIAAHDQSKD
jgi:hypothetical protein